MTDTRGTFRLKNVRQDILNNEYVSIPSVFIANDKFGHGHFFDGQLRRYNISNSTVVKAGPTYFVRYHDTGGGSQEHTYWSGGGSNTSTISKLVYSTYTTTASLPTKVLSSARNQMASVSKNTDVYYTGGNYPSVPSVSTTQKLTFSNDSIALLPGSHYPKTEDSMASFNDGGTYGYFWGGTVGTTDTKVMRLTFSNDTMAALPGTTYPASTPAYSGMWNLGNTTKGYNVGGVWISNTKKLTYASETFVAAPGANYPNSIGQATAFTAGADTGLVNSGRSPAARSDTNLLTFSTDSWAAAPAMDNPDISSNGNDYGTGTGTSARDSKIGGAPSYTKDGSNRWFDDASQSGPADVGYFRGWTTDDTSWVDKLDFNTETISAGTPTSNTKKSTKSACGDTRNGYLGDHPSASQGGTEKLDFNKDTWSSLPGANLYPTSNGGYNNGAAVSSPSKIYMTGWSSSGNVTAIETSTATSTEIPGSGSNSIYYATTPGSSARYYSAAAGNKTHGYFIGGRLSGPGNSESRVYKYTYSSETSSVNPGLGVYSYPGPGNNGINFHQASESSTAGYVIGGRQQPASPTSYSPSYIGKFPFATETYSQSAGQWNPLWGSIQQQIFVTGATKGYLFGEPSSSAFKFDYASDSGAVVPAMTEPRWPTKYYGGQGAMSPSDSHLDRFDPPVATPTNTTIIGTTPAPDVGYFTGGPHYTSTDKLNFTNDTMAAGADMVTPRYNHVCWGNGTNFLDAGGTIANGADRDSRIEKITLSNNTVGALPGANMPNKKRFFVGATGNDNTGYIAGGQTPSSPGTSSILKITYATYTTDANPGCHLGSAGYTQGAGGHGIGSPTAAYIVAGMPSGSIGEGWHKIPYATNTATYTRPGQFDNPGAGRGDDQSTGNKDKGYVTGYNPGSFSTSKTTEVVFATDTASNSTYSPNLGYALNRGATGNQTTGYFHGGLPGPAGGAGNDSYITKFVYSSDTISQLPASSKMTVPRTHCDAGSGVENSHNLSSNTALI
tara:strand:- start:1049 stop:4075 length:3027 start_codon:yes stop_codon:yes gene_type:complete